MRQRRKLSIALLCAGQEFWGGLFDVKNASSWGTTPSRPSWICCPHHDLAQPPCKAAPADSVAQRPQAKGQRSGCAAVPRCIGPVADQPPAGGSFPSLASNSCRGPDHRGRTAYRRHAVSTIRISGHVRQPNPALPTPPPAVRQSRRFTVGSTPAVFSPAQTAAHSPFAFQTPPRATLRRQAVRSPWSKYV